MRRSVTLLVWQLLLLVSLPIVVAGPIHAGICYESRKG